MSIVFSRQSPNLYFPTVLFSWERICDGDTNSDAQERDLGNEGHYVVCRGADPLACTAVAEASSLRISDGTPRSLDTVLILPCGL